MKLSVICGALLFVCVTFGQETPAKPEFEVVSIKAAQPMPMGQMRVMMNADAGMLRYTNVSLKDCIRVAYRVKEYQVEGPDWLGSTRFDIVAKLPEGASKEQIPEMLQAMLADRLKLVTHRDTKEHAVYALVVGKNGPKLKAAETTVSDAASPPGKPAPGSMPKGAMMMGMGPGGMHLNAHSVTLPSLGEMISRFCERPVVDMTGIQGQYDFDLAFAPETMHGMPAPGGPGMQPGPTGGSGNGGPSSAGMANGATTGPMAPGADHTPAQAPAEAVASIFDAVQRYGLKLEPRKAPMETVVVDHVEKTPTEN
jgi:uncharacterized protein (TIGR03435 family)